MKKRVILAVGIALAAILAGCELQAVIPAFLLPADSFVTTPPAVPTETETPQVSSSATATVSQSAAPTANPSADPYPVIQRYDSALPDGLSVSLQYDSYATPMNYFAALKGGWVYEKPDAKSKKLRSFSLGVRIGLDRLVTGTDGKSRWFHVSWTDEKGKHEGYAKESTGRGRSFRIGMMLQQAMRLKAETDKENTVYIVNYKNGHGEPPALPDNSTFDPHGYRRDQSAPAYTEPDTKSAFRYAPDGMLGTKLAKTNGMTQVFLPSFNENRWVPDRYISKEPDAIGSLNQVVVVDRLNQNSAVFEYGNNAWTLISMTFVSTGKDGGYALKTPLGDFMAQTRLSKFYYYKDGTKDIEGYAPWAVRFSAGGYLHGVPRKFKFDEMGNRIDPGPAEALRTLGTTPQSHMCVRNYTSYAKFVYDWFKKGQTAVIVIE